MHCPCAFDTQSDTDMVARRAECRLPMAHLLVFSRSVPAVVEEVRADGRFRKDLQGSRFRSPSLPPPPPLSGVPSPAPSVARISWAGPKHTRDAP